MTCRACGGTTLTLVFEMAPMPLAGSFAATRQDAIDAEKFRLQWYECRTCGLVNVAPDIADERIYATYSYAASTVPALVRHHTDLAKRLSQRYRLKHTRLLEIGCNDGVLLKRLPATWDIVGVDPSDVARDTPHAYPLIPRLRPQDVVSLGRFDVATSSNSLAHFTDIGGTLDAVAMVLKPGGEFWIEVHDLDATLASGQWDTIYHEHKVEWSEDSLKAAILPRGFAHVRTERLALHGGLLRVIFRRGWKRSCEPVYRDFAGLRQAYANRQPVKADAAYGAAARASVYLNQCDTGAQYVVDGSPLRAGRFVPGVGLPIVPPEAFDSAPPATTLITAWNHADDIRSRHPGYGGWVSAW